jgi:hypothetical protein
MNTDRTNVTHWTSLAGNASRQITELQTILERLGVTLAMLASEKVVASGHDAEEVVARLDNLTALDECRRRGNNGLGAVAARPAARVRRACGPRRLRNMKTMKSKKISTSNVRGSFHGGRSASGDRADVLS